MTTTTTIGFSLSHELFAHVVDCAGYGCKYWAYQGRVSDESYSIWPDDEKQPITISKDQMEAVLLKMATGKIDCGSLSREAASRAVFFHDGADIDATVADVIIQLCCFSEVVYG